MVAELHEIGPGVWFRSMGAAEGFVSSHDRISFSITSSYTSVTPLVQSELLCRTLTDRQPRIFFHIHLLEPP